MLLRAGYVVSDFRRLIFRFHRLSLTSQFGVCLTIHSEYLFSSYGRFVEHLFIDLQFDLLSIVINAKFNKINYFIFF